MEEIIDLVDVDVFPTLLTLMADVLSKVDWSVLVEGSAKVDGCIRNNVFIIMYYLFHRLIIICHRQISSK